MRDICEAAALTVADVKEAPWRFSAGAYQAALGVHAPWIAEISPMQYAHMGKAQKAAYDKRRAAEWDASAAVKREWADAVVAAWRAGKFDPKDGDVHPDAAQEVRWAQQADAKAAKEAERADKNRANEITDVSQVKKGDRVFVLISGTYGEVLRVSRKSVQVSGRFGPMKVEISPRRPLLLWKSYNDLHGKAEAMETVGGMLEAVRTKAISPDDIRDWFLTLVTGETVNSPTMPTFKVTRIDHNGMFPVCRWDGPSRGKGGAADFVDALRDAGVKFKKEKYVPYDLSWIKKGKQEQVSVRSMIEALEEMSDAVRAKMPKQDFVFPAEKRWPIKPRKYAIAAIQYMVMGRGDSADYPAVKKAIKAAYADDAEVLDRLQKA